MSFQQLKDKYDNYSQIKIILELSLSTVYTTEDFCVEEVFWPEGKKKKTFSKWSDISQTISILYRQSYYQLLDQTIT